MYSLLRADYDITQLVSPTIDVVFKALFGTEAGKSRLISLISSVTNLTMDDIEDLTILNTELGLENARDKLPRVDVRARLKNGTDVDIEVQVNPTSAYNQRVLYYWSKIYSSNLQQGMDYSKLKKCIVINFVNFNHFQHPEMHSVFRLYRENSNPMLCLTDHLELHFIELSKLNPYNRSTEKELLIDWVDFLNMKVGESFMALKQKALPEEIIKAFEELEILSRDPEMREIALNREIALRDEIFNQTGYLEVARAEALAAGKEEQTITIAKKLKALGQPTVLIAEATGLSPEVIEKL